MYTVLPQVFYDVAQECIEPFRSCFSRGAAFRHFANFVLSKCVGTYEHGVTDSIRIHSHQMEYPDLNRCYENLIKFFRAGSYSLGDLEKCWMSLMSGSGRAFRKDGRAIITIDGHNAIRCGRYMPAVQKMMQNSESPTKPQVTFGHLWGVCSVLAGSEESKIYPIPLTAEIQSGDEVIRGWETESKMPQKSDERGFVLHEDGEKNFTGSHVERLVRNAIATGRDFGKIYLLGDRYFLSAKTLTLIHGLCPNNEVVFVTKARRNCMAYRIPEKNAEAKKGRGRPRKKGDRVSVSSLFSEKGKFRKATVKIYGKNTELGYREEILLWGLGLYQKLKFVLVEYDGVQSILVSDDISMDAKSIIEHYSLRWKCEQLYKVQSQTTGAYDSHFWTKALPKLDRYRRKDSKNPLDDVDSDSAKIRILKTFRAYERYTFMSLVAHGITQILALELAAKGYRSPLYLRTKPKKVCSEENITRDLGSLFLKGIASTIMKPIPDKNKKASPCLPNKACLNRQ